jgi:hypothetical protein
MQNFFITGSWRLADPHKLESSVGLTVNVVHCFIYVVVGVGTEDVFGALDIPNELDEGDSQV